MSRLNPLSHSTVSPEPNSATALAMASFLPQELSVLSQRDNTQTAQYPQHSRTIRPNRRRSHWSGALGSWTTYQRLRGKSPTGCAGRKLPENRLLSDGGSLKSSFESV